MANDKTYYVKLKPSAGGKLIPITGVNNYARTDQTIPGEVYRDEYTFTPGTLDGGSHAFVKAPVFGPDGGVVPTSTNPNTEVKYMAPDTVTHEPPRQSTYDRLAHIFSNDVGDELGFFWDDFVVGVTNDPNQV